MPSPDNQKLAEKIARLLEGESAIPENAALFAAIEKINYRLDKIEAAQQSAIPRSSTLDAPLTAHPSLDKLQVAEAIADAVFAGMQGMHKEKACQFEPDKPCDHCLMCNSRGF
ncbi:MAG: hypothetical protein ACJ73D_06400 [Pyrinomonadaceae bacterium]